MPPVPVDLELTILFRVGVATVLTALLGWEREAVGKAAGLRTHILVGVGSTLFVGLGELLVAHFDSYGDRLQFDPTRVLEAVVAGVSFLGAGVIFFGRSRERVQGLTTAASIWTTAGVGMAVGLGSYVLALGVTALLLLVLRGLLLLEQHATRREPADRDPPPPSPGGGRDELRTSAAMLKRLT